MSSEPEATYLYTDSERDDGASYSREDGHEDNLVNEFPEPSSDSALVHRRCVVTPGNPTLPPPAAGPRSFSQVSPPNTSWSN